VKKIAIIANGTIKDNDFHKKLLQDFDIVICADGGANIAKELQITPDYIIGDLDSIKSSVLSYFKDLNETEIIKDDNQDKTDLELAIVLAESLDPSEITIFGAMGGRIDHTLANILCLCKIPSEIKTQIIDERNSVELVEDSIDLDGNIGDIISIVPITDISNLYYNGLKWNVKNRNTNIGWFGISNLLENNHANISFSKGKILVIRVRE
jgi:thiamine pyrophosphokinase